MNGTSKKYPDFFKVYLPEYSSERLMIPPKFVKKYGDELSVVATLSVANARVWQVGLTKEENSIYFHDGWHEFVEYYSIRHGHFLVFSYKGISNFHVVIFDKTACEIDYPFNGPSREQEPNHDKQYPVLNEDEMEDDDSIEISGFTSPLEERVFNESSKKRAMNKRFNPSSKQDCPGSTKNGNGNETRSKNCRMEDQAEIIDLVNVEYQEEEEVDDDDDDDEEEEEDEDDDNAYDDYEEVEEEEDKEETEEEENTINKSRSQKNIGRNNNGMAAPVKIEEVDVRKYVKTTNPFFVTKLRKTRKNSLYVPVDVVRDHNLTLPKRMIFRDEHGRDWPGELFLWTDGRTWIEGWHKVCKWNHVTKSDRCICEFLQGRGQGGNVIKVHIVREGSGH